MRLRPNIYITRPIPQAAVDTLLTRCDVSLCNCSGDYVPREELLRGVKGVTAILCMPTDNIDKEVLQLAGPELMVVATMSEDCDHIDTEECKQRGIHVIKIPGDSNETIVDLTIALLLQALHHRDRELDDEQDPVIRSNPRNLRKDRIRGSFSVEMSNRTLGIYKFGHLGLSIARRLKNLGISRIIYYDITEVVSAKEVSAEFVPFEQLLNESDILCLCSEKRASSSTSEDGMFDRKAFKKMSKSAILIEATKSPVLDYEDLYMALKEGDIQCAGLDVREYDTTPYKHQLSGLSNCHFLPYRECYEWDGRREISVDLASKILSVLSDIRNSLRESA